MFMANAFFLIYTTAVVPIQICLWNYEDPCNKFPTLYFDLIVDTFFMVGPPMCPIGTAPNLSQHSRTARDSST